MEHAGLRIVAIKTGPIDLDAAHIQRAQTREQSGQSSVPGRSEGSHTPSRGTQRCAMPINVGAGPISTNSSTPR